MNYYYPVNPNPKKPNDFSIGRIIAIIVLFSIGLWPIGVYLIWKSISKSKQPYRRIPKPTNRKPGQKIYGEYAPYQAPVPPRDSAARQPNPAPNTASNTDRPAAGDATPVASKASQAPVATGAIKKPWWHFALNALSIAIIAVGSLFSFSALGSLLGGTSLADALAIFAPSALSVILGGSFLLILRNIALQDARKIRFCNVVGTRKVMKLNEMAATLGLSYAQMVKELQRYLDKGLFPGGYIDHARKLLVVSAQGVNLDEMADSFPADTTNDTNEASDAHSDMLHRIHAVNSRITNPSVSQKAQRIEEITALIIEAVKRDPAKEKKTGTFMGYYLPTTLKILNAYEQFEQQGVNGENLQSAMRDIENILDHLVSGFERQLDLLFENDVLDISSDISVLESMLAKDGLTDDGFTIPKN